MNFKQLHHQLLIVITAIALFFSSVSSALAADTYNYQNNQELNQPATLTTATSDRQVKFYPQPDLRQAPSGIAQTGDRVTVLQQIEGNKGKQWDYVKFDNEQQSEGWIQQDFVVIQTQQYAQNEQKPTPQSQSQSSSTDSQQADYPKTKQSNKYQTNQQKPYSQEKQNQKQTQSYQRNQ